MINGNFHSPCTRCFSRGIVYNENSKTCSTCEYEYCMKLLKKILYSEENCSMCKNCKSLGGGNFDCRKHKQEECGGKYYEINWDKVMKEYPLLTAKAVSLCP